MSAQRLSLVQWLFAYGVVLVVMGLLDGVWLGWLAKNFYKQELGGLMTDSVRVVPAALYYLGYPAAVVYLALVPARSVPEALLRSAILGLTAFGVFDLTNLAIIRGYSLRMTVADMAWGTFATALGGVGSYVTVIGRLSAG